MLFTEPGLTKTERVALDTDGHVLLPGRLTPEARAALITALADIESQAGPDQARPRRYSAEHNDYLASLIANPEMIALVQAAIGPEIRFDHCVALNRAGGDNGADWHSHDYAEDRPDLAFVRVFFYINGFTPNDGGLKAVSGSHLYRDPKIRARSGDQARSGVDKDEAFRAGWLMGKTHPLTGAPLTIENLTAPEGSVILMHTHAAHAVSPRQAGSPMRWCVVYAYRNPGAPVSVARWISKEFEQSPPPGAEWLMPEQ
ncbi:MAG TPA: phytanoyl-CoA dioxygenase family protein [Armatimonadota bacterium]|nr:phytanoyl-CoA dioxygenase family protein [Armatimonadota bacterium]